MKFPFLRSHKVLSQVNHKRVYATGRQDDEDGQTLECDNRYMAITCVFCRDYHRGRLALMFSGLLRKDLFKGR